MIQFRGTECFNVCGYRELNNLRNILKVILFSFLQRRQSLFIAWACFHNVSELPKYSESRDTDSRTRGYGPLYVCCKE